MGAVRVLKTQRIMGSSSEYITDDFNVAALRSGTTAMG